MSRTIVTICGTRTVTKEYRFECYDTNKTYTIRPCTIVRRVCICSEARCNTLHVETRVNRSNRRTENNNVVIDSNICISIQEVIVSVHAETKHDDPVQTMRSKK